MYRVLVVEDEPVIALGLQDDLELEGYDVEVVADGLRAVERGKEGGFDLIVLDVMLPGKSGFEVCRELRRMRVPSAILILSAKSQVEEKVLGLELGADDYLAKPFDALELRARIKALLRRNQGSEAKTYTFGDCLVDFDRYQVLRNSRPVELTPLEFKILSALIRHKGRVLSRNVLLELIWGPDAYLTERVVDTHVNNIRKKIEPEPSQPKYLVSLRGIGYRFDG